jgi:hypothetical protein
VTSVAGGKIMSGSIQFLISHEKKILLEMRQFRRREQQNQIKKLTFAVK